MRVYGGVGGWGVDRGDRNTGMRGHTRSIRLLGGGLGCSVVGINAEQTITLHSNIFSIWQADRQTDTRPCFVKVRRGSLQKGT